MADQLKDNLYPVSGDHSVREVVITLFLNNLIEHPESYQSLLPNFSNQFQKFEQVGEIEFKISPNEATISSSPRKIENVGFRFISYDEGKAKCVLQGINEQIRNFISFHSLKYPKWQIYLGEFLNAIKVILTHQTQLSIKAFSLHYTDEFLYKGTELSENIFNKASSLLPKDFFDGILNQYEFATQNKEDNSLLDKLYINIETGMEPVPSKIIVTHTTIKQLKEVITLDALYNSGDLLTQLETFHFYNKKMLNNLLTKEVCELINLNNTNQ